MSSEETSWITTAPTSDLRTKEQIPALSIILDAKVIKGELVGVLGGKTVYLRLSAVSRLDKHKRMMENVTVWTRKDPNDYPHIWHPAKRMMTVEDAEDLHSGKIIKKDTIFEDWCDNEDGTVEATLDGKVVYRLWKDSITKLLL